MENMEKLIMKQLLTEAEWLDGFSLLQQLRQHLTKESFLKVFPQMQKEGYKLFALYDQDEMVAIAGVNILTNFYDGRHLYVYDLVTHPTKRSNGYGEQLLRYLHEWGKEQQCIKLVLSSGLWRYNAHRFYEEKMGYEKVYYVFSTPLA